MAEKKQPLRHTGPKPYVVSKPAELLTFLLEALKGQSRTSVKSILAHQMVSVNGKTVKQFNHALKGGDKITIGKAETEKAKEKLPLDILFEDPHLVVIDKPSGLLTIATEGEKTQTAYRMVGDYLKSSNPKAKVFVLHRLDRDTSGVMMFAKSQEVQAKLQQNWDDDVIDRQYQAVVEGKLKAAEGVLDNFLVENKNGMVQVTRQTGLGKRAITKFKLLKSSTDYSLLNLTLATGRKNQIRVQLSHIGYPVAGDKKYGSRTNPLKRLALHAGLLAFVHPITGAQMSFRSPMPTKFNSLFK